MNISDYLSTIDELCLDIDPGTEPWQIISLLDEMIVARIKSLPTEEYDINGTVAVHKTAQIDETAILKGHLIVGKNCFVGPFSMLRGSVVLGESCSIGPSCEVKTSIICDNSSLGHFNFVGDSIVGSNVNFEAGALTANHHNDREDKRIFINEKDIGVTKFGAVVGDDTKLGANSATSPGTVLDKGTIVDRLELI